MDTFKADLHFLATKIAGLSQNFGIFATKPKNHDGFSPVTVSWKIDNGNQTMTKTFYPPFKHVDRIEDYKTAYRVFSERLGLNTNADSSEATDARG